MPNAEFTKLMIAGGLKQILETTPFAEVAVVFFSQNPPTAQNSVKPTVF